MTKVNKRKVDIRLIFGMLWILTSVLFLIMGFYKGVQERPDTFQYHEYVDSETGVNYIWIESDSGIGIIPRYSRDGSLYISDPGTIDTLMRM